MSTLTHLSGWAVAVSSAFVISWFLWLRFCSYVINLDPHRAEAWIKSVGSAFPWRRARGKKSKHKKSG